MSRVPDRRPGADHGDLTRLLHELPAGRRDVVDRVYALLYDELRALADRAMSRERGDHTLQTTALVHESYVRLATGAQVEWRDRAHFMALAARVMRQVLVDHARARGRGKRGGGLQRVTLTGDLAAAPQPGNFDALDLERALDVLAAEHPEKARVVEMRFFGGMSQDEIAEVEAVTTRTVERHWRFARAWLLARLDEGPAAGA
jgi:RNA polymerase sigma factor (TIGR02999 family)